MNRSIAYKSERQKFQFPLRGIFGWTTAIAIVLALLVPYPTQLTPSLRIEIVDENGLGLRDQAVEWEGGFYAHSEREHVWTDNDGTVELPKLWVRLNSFSRLAGFLSSLAPHSSFRKASASVDLLTPRGLRFVSIQAIGKNGTNFTLKPENSVAITEAFPDSVWSVSFDSLPDHLIIFTEAPSSRVRYEYRVVYESR